MTDRRPSAPGQASTPAETEKAVVEAEKRVGAVLDDLEVETGGKVHDIRLDDMVDTDPASGRPVVKKAVDIEVHKRETRGWLR